MTQHYQITEADIWALASEQSFERGRRYHNSNAVSGITRRGNLITAEVAGSEFEPYQVQVALSEAGIVNTFCTCPYDWGGICKHIVAVLLDVMHQPEIVVEKPTINSLLADLAGDQLRKILLGLAEAGPEYVEAIEREVAWLRDQPATSTPSSSIPVAVNINDVRREIHKDFRQAGRGDSFRYGYYDEYSGLEMDPERILAPHLERVAALLDAGDVDAAVTLISAIIESYADGLANLDEWVYEYNMDAVDSANLELGEALAEVLLSLDRLPEQRERWLAQIGDWTEQLGDLDIAKTAVEQGWFYPPLVAAMQGNIIEKGAWEGEAPYYADELAQARLRVLARQGRAQEYINLAEAEGQVELAVNMMAQSGDTEKAVAEAKAYLVFPEAVLSLAHVLVAKGQVEAALNVAEHGLSLEGLYGKVELARWTRERAAAAGHHDLALEAAQMAFATSYELDDYTAVKQLAGDEWATIQPMLLQELEQCRSVTHKIDIYLNEGMVAESMWALDGNDYAPDHDLRRVIAVTREKHPNWGIRQCKRKAEAIIGAGKSGVYETAVSWLETARDIYYQYQRQREWETYLDELLATHQRKYKLVPMLRSIRT
jgi:uncharacterized Zn finger protein